MAAPDSQAKHACRQAAIPLNALFKNPEPPLATSVVVRTSITICAPLKN